MQDPERLFEVIRKVTDPAAEEDAEGGRSDHDPEQEDGELETRESEYPDGATIGGPPDEGRDAPADVRPKNEAANQRLHGPLFGQPDGPETNLAGVA